MVSRPHCSRQWSRQLMRFFPRPCGFCSFLWISQSLQHLLPATRAEASQIRVMHGAWSWDIFSGLFLVLFRPVQLSSYCRDLAHDGFGLRSWVPEQTDLSDLASNSLYRIRRANPLMKYGIHWLVPGPLKCSSILAYEVSKCWPSSFYRDQCVYFAQYFEWLNFLISPRYHL